MALRGSASTNRRTWDLVADELLAGRREQRVLVGRRVAGDDEAVTSSPHRSLGRPAGSR